MKAVSTATLTDALRWRYATKKFDANRRIPLDQWQALEEAMVLAPSSFGLQPWRFIVVETPEIRAQLPAMSWGQTQTVDCSHYVVFAVRKGLTIEDVDRYVDRIAEVRGATRESLEGYRSFMLGSHKAASEHGRLDAWSSCQVYIALGQAMAAAALLGIDTCPLEGIEPAKYDALLGLEQEGYSALCGLAFGYRADDDKYAELPKVRFAKADVIKHA
jgi:nitroreductase